MAGERIAGHWFIEDLNGIVCNCNVKLREITGARREDIGKLGWAHVGALTETEYLEIKAYSDRIWQSVIDSSTTN